MTINVLILINVNPFAKFKINKMLGKNIPFLSLKMF